MGVIGGQAIAKDFDSETLQSFPNDLAIAIAILSELEQVLPIMATMCQMVEFTGQKVAVGSGHARQDESTGNPCTPKSRPKIGRKGSKRGV